MPGITGMGLGDLAERLGEGEVLVGVEVLAGEEHDLALEQDGSDGGDLLVGQRPAQVDAADLRADRAGQRGEVAVGSSSRVGVMVMGCAPCRPGGRGRRVRWTGWLG